MKRVYLDWNVISNLKRAENKEFRESLLSLRNMFILPFSPAHFEDIMKSFNYSNNIKFYEDIETCNSLFGDHLIMYDEKADRVNPYIATPEMFLESILSNRFSLQLYTGRIPSHIYNEKDVHNANDKSLRMPSVEDVINNLLSATVQIPLNFLNNPNLVDNIRRFTTGKSSAKKLSGQKPERAFDYLNKLLEKHCNGATLDTLLQNYSNALGSKGEEKKFISSYLSLDLYQYRADRHKSFMNIITDAKHAYYASYCDYFVTDDRKCSAKSAAIYKKNGIKTEIISSKELINTLNREIDTEFNLKGFLRNIPGMLHFRKQYPPDVIHTNDITFSSPFLGFYNNLRVIYQIDTKRFFYIFSRILKERDMVFFSEFDKLMEILYSVNPNMEWETELRKYRFAIKEHKENYLSNIIIGHWIVSFCISGNKGDLLPQIIITRKKH